MSQSRSSDSAVACRFALADANRRPTRKVSPDPGKTVLLFGLQNLTLLRVPITEIVATTQTQPLQIRIEPYDENGEDGRRGLYQNPFVLAPRAFINRLSGPGVNERRFDAYRIRQDQPTDSIEGSVSYSTGVGGTRTLKTPAITVQLDD